LSVAATGNPHKNTTSVLHDLKQTTAKESHKVKTEACLEIYLLVHLSELQPLQFRNSSEIELTIKF